MQTGRDCANYFIDGREFDAIAAWLGEAPETVIPVHSLHRGLCRAFARGDAPRYEAAIIQLDCSPSEPMAFGSDPRAVFEVLCQVENWTGLNVNQEIAQELAHIMAKVSGLRVRRSSDLYYVLGKPVADFRHHDVRELVPDDVALLDAAPLELRGCGFRTSLEMLTEGVVACGLISSRVIAIGYTSAISGGYADIGVHTSVDWRGRGFATACASLVANRAQRMGLTPVWSTSDDNPASIMIAEKIGFERVSRRACLTAGARSGDGHTEV